jgi:hypothetical protein
MAYIVNDLPKPKIKHTGGFGTKGQSRWPFAKLEIGQSFMVPNKKNMPPGESVEDASTEANMRTHVSRHNRKIFPDRKFICKVYEADTHWLQIYREY